ncbi:unnamed protein product [Effrenium voratum]|nr:unnamed protein product [Effrenium voratum]
MDWAERADQLLQRAQQLQQQLTEDEVGTQSTLKRPEPSRLSNRAVAELELILAEDPMCAGAKVASSNEEKDSVAPALEVPAPAAVEVTKESAVPTKPAAQLLEDFDGLRLQFRRLELTSLGLRQTRDSDGLWLQCRIALGDKRGEPVEEVLLRCQGDSNVEIQHSSHVRKAEPADWREVATQPLRLGLLTSKAARGHAAPKGQALHPVAEAELLWFAALLEPGTACPFTAELRAVNTGKSTLVGRLHLSLELTNSSGIHEVADAGQHSSDSGIHLRIWLGSIGMEAAELRAVLKLGPTQEMAMPARAGVFGQAVVSSSSIWKGDGTEPTFSCIFVQIWQGAELCGLVKLVLPQLKADALQNINCGGVEKLLEAHLDIQAVATDRRVGKVEVLMQAGLQPILLAMETSNVQSEQREEDRVSGLLLLACHLEELDSELALTEATLRSCAPSLTSREAVAISQAFEGPEAWAALMATLQAVQRSADGLVAEVGDECASVGLDFLDVAAPIKLQRQDMARILRIRGVQLGWNTLESVFQSLCTDSALPAAHFTRLFRCCAERRTARVAKLRHLEAQVLEEYRRNQCSDATFVSAYSKSDGTLDLLGLTVLLRSLGPFLRQDVEALAEYLLQKLGALGARTGSVAALAVQQWLHPGDLSERDGTNKAKDKATGWAEHITEDQREMKEENRNLGEVNDRVISFGETVREEVLQQMLVGAQSLDKAPEEAQRPSRGRYQGASARQAVPLSSFSKKAQATVQLSKPLHRDDCHKLEEVLSRSLELGLDRLGVIGAEEGALRICVQIQPPQWEGEVTAEAAMRRLAAQLEDSTLSLGALGRYFT